MIGYLLTCFNGNDFGDMIKLDNYETVVKQKGNETMKVKEELLYSSEHEWVEVDGNKARIGITDYAQDSLGDIAYVEMPEEGDEFVAGDAFGVIESVKTASDLYTPVSGIVIAINEEAESDPALINSDPYYSWIVEIELADKEELEALMNAESYREYADK